jgi:hypothetical protein
MKFLETHKHLAITICCLLGLWFLAHDIESYRERMADKAESGLKVQLTAKDAEIGKRDKDFSDFKTQMMNEIAGIKTAKQGVTVLQPIMQGAAPQGVTKADLPQSVHKELPPDSKPDTHYSLFSDDQVISLAKNAEACRITEAGLSTCEADKRTMQEKIDDLAKQNKKWEDAGTVPRWTLMAGVSKTRDGGYKPAAMLSYRVTHHTGIAFGAVNNALVGGFNFNFGGTPK